MVTIKAFRKLANSLSGITEEPHFEKTSFRVKGRIFATFEKKTDTVCVKLSPDDQALFSSGNEKSIYPVANSWGKKGWTLVDLKNTDREMVSDLLAAAYSEVSRKK